MFCKLCFDILFVIGVTYISLFVKVYFDSEYLGAMSPRNGNGQEKTETNKKMIKLKLTIQ